MNHIQYIMGSEVVFDIYRADICFLSSLQSPTSSSSSSSIWRCFSSSGGATTSGTWNNPSSFAKDWLPSTYSSVLSISFRPRALSLPDPHLLLQQWRVDIILRNLILIPQIIHNVRLGNNPGFNLYYIFGFIGSRLLIPMYERLCPENRFSLTPNITLVVVLLALYAL